MAKVDYVKNRRRRYTIPDISPVWVAKNIKSPEDMSLDKWVKIYKPPYYVEPKYDGERGILFKLRDKVYIVNRHKTVYELPPYLKDKVLRATKNYKVVVFDGEFHSKDNKFPSFLHYRPMHTIDDMKNLQYHIFDVLNVEGLDVRNYRLEKRKRMIKIRKNDFMKTVKDNTAKNENDVKHIFKNYVDKGFEGVVVKNPKSMYLEKGGWLKLKKKNTLDFAVLGIYKSKSWNEKKLPTSFLIGLYDKENDSWAVIGKVGSGLNIDEKRRISSMVKELKYREDNDFLYLYPYLTFEVDYQEITEDGSLRSPRIIRIRDDKPPEETYKDYKRFLELWEKNV